MTVDFEKNSTLHIFFVQSWIFFKSDYMFCYIWKKLRKCREVNSTLCVYNFLPGIMSDFCVSLRFCVKLNTLFLIFSKKKKKEKKTDFCRKHAACTFVALPITFSEEVQCTTCISNFFWKQQCPASQLTSSSLVKRFQSTLFPTTWGECRSETLGLGRWTYKQFLDFNFLSQTVESFQIVSVSYLFHWFHMSTDRISWEKGGVFW